MVVIVGPCFSLAASGSVGKVLLYYDTKFGARLRIVKRRFESPGMAWEVNKTWFRNASDRAKTITTEQKRAWAVAHQTICDNWRDIFMGHQIEMWNASPLNDITWPGDVPHDVGTITLQLDNEFATAVHATILLDTFYYYNKWCPNFLWFRVLDTPRAPRETDYHKATLLQSSYITLEAGHDNYIWIGVRYVNGTWKVKYLGKFVR